MKYTLRYLLILPPLLLSQLAAAVTYPSKQGAKVERSVDSEVVLQLQQRTRNYRAVNPAKHYTATKATNGSKSSVIYTGSGATTSSYGGGTSATNNYNSASNKGFASVQSASGLVNIGSTRIKSSTTGSSFESTETPVMANDYAPTALRGDQAPPPPPGPGQDNTDENQLPVGNGILTLLLCCTMYGVRSKEQRPLR